MSTAAETAAAKAPRIVSSEEWLAARMQLLEKEKEFTKKRDELTSLRQDMPWVKVEKNYTFMDKGGVKVTLADLFEDCSQLVVYHFMFDKEWENGCSSCSFWADNYNGTDMHLAARDTSLVVVSIAPIEKLQAFKERMGWTFRWVSSVGSEFNRDHDVSFTPEELKEEVYYNFKKNKFPATEAPGISVFAKRNDGSIYHTYSCYARGLDMMNGTYHTLDLTPKGRDEDELPYSMSWLRLHDKYGN